MQSKFSDGSNICLHLLKSVWKAKESSNGRIKDEFVTLLKSYSLAVKNNLCWFQYTQLCREASVLHVNYFQGLAHT